MRSWVSLEEFYEMKAQLDYWKRGHEIIEKAMKVAHKGDWHDAPMPLVEDEARLWLRAQAEAYQHALEMMGIPSEFPPALSTQIETNTDRGRR